MIIIIIIIIMITGEGNDNSAKEKIEARIAALQDLENEIRDN